MEAVLHKTRHLSLSGGSVLFAVLAVLLFVFPLIRLILLSLTAEDGSLSAAQYEALLQDPRAGAAIFNTIYISVSAAAISAVCGTATAFLTAYTNIRYKKLIEGLVFLPFVIPAYVMTISWTGLTSSGGALTMLLAAAGLPALDLYTPGGIIAMLGICHMSVVHVTVIHRLRKIPVEADWAARTSGCSPWSAVRKVDIPMAAPAIASGAVLAFLADVDNFAVPAFLGISSNIPVLSTYIYEKVISFGPDSFAYGAVLSVVLSVIALAGTLIAARLGGRTDTGEGGRESRDVRIAFSPAVRRTVEIATAGALIFFSVVPFCYMAVSALLRTFNFSLDPADMTLENYAFVFTNDGIREAALNSLFMAGLGTAACLVLGTIIAYGIVRSKNRAARFLEGCASMTYSVPGIVLALALIFYWSQPVPGVTTGLYGSYTILILGYATRYMIVQIKNSATAMASMSAAAEEAALVSGSSFLRMWVKIIVPQLAAPALAGSFFIFLSAFTELTMSSVMSSASTKTIGLAIFNLQQAGDYSLAAAVSSVILAVMILCCAVRWAFEKRKQ